MLSAGRLLAGVGPASSPRDYAAAGIGFDERWPRFEEAVSALRAWLTPGAPGFDGRFYSTRGIEIEPAPLRTLPLWIASWGSTAGLRRVARLGDGWLASGLHATPAALGLGLRRLEAELADAGRDAAPFPNACGTIWLYIADRRRDADRVIADVLAPMLDLPVDAARRLGLPIGTVEQCAESVSAYAREGAQRLFLWPLADEMRQIERFWTEVVPLVEAPQRRRPNAK